MFICEHDWKGKTGTVQCGRCRAVGLFDKNKDPFSEGEPIVLRPSEIEWRKLTFKERSVILGANKNYIMADFIAIGRMAACKKWSIPLGTVSGFLRRMGSYKQTKPHRIQSELSNHPALPDFDNTWAAEVQARWLRIYARLLECGKTNHV